MSSRYFKNPFPSEFTSADVVIPKDLICKLIKKYVDYILHETYNERDRRGDLYVGSAGIAFMFYRISQSELCASFPDALNHAKHYIKKSKDVARHHDDRDKDNAAFLCGNAGIWCVSAAISKASGEDFKKDLDKFSTGLNVVQNLIFNDYGNDEILFGRAGYLSGILWLNQIFGVKKYFKDEQVVSVCNKMFESGVKYSEGTRYDFPLMYECYSTQYIGAAHGISAIYHMFLEVLPLMHKDTKKVEIIRKCLEKLRSLQRPDGNFPSSFEKGDNETKLIHWCHGAPGVIYAMIKAHLTYNNNGGDDDDYKTSAERCAELVWQKGLLRKGPGICHGIAGNGYVFLMMYRLTNDSKYLYRAIKFAEFLENPEFLREARTPDRPSSLYEGYAGTICFLLDLLQPQKAAFPFMDCFEQKV